MPRILEEERLFSRKRIWKDSKNKNWKCVLDMALERNLKANFHTWSSWGFSNSVKLSILAKDNNKSLKIRLGIIFRTRMRQTVYSLGTYLLKYHKHLSILSCLLCPLTAELPFFSLLSYLLAISNYIYCRKTDGLTFQKYTFPLLHHSWRICWWKEELVYKTVWMRFIPK